MLVPVTVNAECVSDLELRVFARWHMARHALQLGVRKDQREPCLRMIRCRECRGQPPLNGVAAFAFASVATLCKLSAMRIRLVAIRTSVMGDRRLEIAGRMTCDACNRRVLSLKGEVRL